MRCCRLVVGALLVAPAFAVAEPPPPTFEIVTSPPDVNDLVFARQAIPPPEGESSLRALAAPRVAQSRIIYLNKNGITVQPGSNDARTNRSTLATQATMIPAWNPSAATWTSTVTCVRDMFSRWDVQITEEDPGNVAHIEAVFGGRPTQLGMKANTAGVAPFTTSCGIVENAIVFTFTQILPEDARMACEIMSQEIAHAYGLDHEMLPPDPMTYLDYDGERAFQDQDAACGEDKERPCGISGTVCRETQNSVQLLTERLGLAGDGGSGGDGGPVPPEITTNSPLDEDTGCASSGGGAGLAVGLGLLGLVASRSRGLQRRRAHR